MKFTLEIELGNDDMQTYGDIMSTLKVLNKRLGNGKGDIPGVGECGIISDNNGNSVGKWAVVND